MAGQRNPEDHASEAEHNEEGIGLGMDGEETTFEPEEDSQAVDDDIAGKGTADTLEPPDDDAGQSGPGDQHDDTAHRR